MRFEHRPYNHGNGGHGYLEYLRHHERALIVLGYHVGREWSPLLEITVYPHTGYSLGKAWDFNIGLLYFHLRLSSCMSELLVGKRRHKVLY